MTTVTRRRTNRAADLLSWLESDLDGVLEARMPSGTTDEEPGRIPSSDGRLEER